MQKNLKRFLALFLTLILSISLSSCTKKTNKETIGLWEQAIYLEDAEIGQGAKSFPLVIKSGERSVRLTVHTDEQTVGAALLANHLIVGEEGPYGLYIKTVNGITADYDVDQSYWAFYTNGEYAMAGVDSTDITEGTEYLLAYTK